MRECILGYIGVFLDDDAFKISMSREGGTLVQISTKLQNTHMETLSHTSLVPWPGGH
jgi:hypothetical protein